jgi:hypothetical protein
MKIIIATPVAGPSVTSLYALAMFHLADHVARQRPQVRLVMPDPIQGALLSRARNAFASRALQDADATHLLFVDSDMSFRPEAVVRMLDFDKDVVGAIYPQRVFSPGEPQRFVGENDVVVGEQGIAVVRGFVQMASLGTGLVLIRRAVFERVREAFPDLLAPVDAHYQGMGVQGEVLQCFEPLRLQSGLYLGEDVSFFRRWSSIGGEMWALADEMIMHAGAHTAKGVWLDKVKAGQYRRDEAGSVAHLPLRTDSA